MIIAIDGPSGTGKSTLAKLLAKQLGFLYFNTGALYRCFAYFILKNNYEPSSEEDLKKALKEFDFDFKVDGHVESYWVEGEDVSLAIRQEKISEIASQISKYAFVRKAFLPIQRSFGKREQIVFEGRDIGTVVFPDAEIKFFLTASSEIRAKRRLMELKSKFPHIEWDFDTILKDIVARDTQDENRKVAPLKKAEDAAVIDTSYLSIEDVLHRMIEIIHSRKSDKS